MDNMFFVEARCQNTKQTFYIRYDKAAGGVWCQTYGVKERPISTSGSANPGNIDISNAVVGPQYRCPYCRNVGGVVCGSCGLITCKPADANNFVCAYCGTAGEISGYASNLRGTSGVGQG